ncbi:MAG: Fic family protein [Rubricoccaceae bacterium]
MRVPQPAPPRSDTLAVLRESLADARKSRLISRELARGPAPDGKYRHWETIRSIPAPAPLTPREIWAIRKMSRQPFYRQLALVDKKRRPFKYALVDPVLERLHRIDREAAGQILLPERTATPGERDRYVTRSLMEEAITSSQLEGAATTRAVAKEMLRSGRAPRDPSEQMVLNNYRAMAYVRERTNEPLTPSFIEGLQRVVTAGTEASGAYRTLGDGVAVYSDANELLHAPPPADQIPERLVKLCIFANEAETGVFLHPVLKSILLHFWLAYDHPFVDGNGRTARVLFYWSMLREGFWLAEFLSVSSVLKRAPARYAKSFLYTETDENDITYFMLAQLRAIELAIKELRNHLAMRAKELREVEIRIGPTSLFNHRQRSLLSHALRHADAVYDIASEQARHGVTYATARADLLGLADAGILTQSKRGRKFIFTVPEDIETRLSNAA